MNNSPVPNHLQNGQQLDYLDGWRGVAISLLLVGHFFPSWRFALGTAGVHLFFVLSGLLMAKQLFLHETPISVFYKRRISRIFPSLYIFVIVVVSFYALAAIPISWKTVIGTVGLVRNYYPVGLDNKLPFDHIWSLSVEEHSYVLLSLVAVFLAGKIRGQRVMLGVFAGVCALFAVWYTLDFNDLSRFIFYSTKFIHTEIAAFGIFFSGFLLLCFSKGISAKIPVIVFYLLPVVALLSHQNDTPFLFMTVIGVGSLALMVNILHLAPAWMLRVLSLPFLRKIGLWSFSLYLWQQPFYYLKSSGIISATAGIVSAVAVGVLSYYLIESPARSYLNRTWARKTSTAEGVAPAVGINNVPVNDAGKSDKSDDDMPLVPH